MDDEGLPLINLLPKIEIQEEENEIKIEVSTDRNNKDQLKSIIIFMMKLNR